MDGRDWTAAAAGAAAILAVAALVAAAGCRRDAGPAWQWIPGGLAEALAAARSEGRLALVEVGASWCPTCHALERDVFGRSAGRLPRGALVGARVDFDTPEGASVARRYGVIGLPTTLVLAPDGSVRGRIEGYDDLESWLEALDRAVRGGPRGVDPAQVAAEAPSSARVQAQAGAELLAAGREEEGLRTLERARALDPDDALGAWRDATRVLGRWHARARGDPAAALPYFREAAERAADLRARWGFAYWTAMMLRQSGDEAGSDAYLAGLADRYPDAAEPPALRAEVLRMTGGDPAAGLALAREAARRAPGDDGHHWLVAVLSERAGDRAGARAAIDRALALSPGEALYEDFRDRLGAAP